MTILWTFNLIVTQFLEMAAAAFQRVVMKSCAALEAYHTLLVLDKRKSLRHKWHLLQIRRNLPSDKTPLRRLLEQDCWVGNER